MTLKVTLIEVLVPLMVICFTAGFVAAPAEAAGHGRPWSIIVGLVAGFCVFFALHRLAVMIERRFDNGTRDTRPKSEDDTNGSKSDLG